jgi:hypothetical protein
LSASVSAAFFLWLGERGGTYRVAQHAKVLTPVRSQPAAISPHVLTVPIWSSAIHRLPKYVQYVNPSSSPPAVFE